jgi:hypothetical protein
MDALFRRVLAGLVEPHGIGAHRVGGSDPRPLSSIVRCSCRSDACGAGGHSTCRSPDEPSHRSLGQCGSSRQLGCCS